MIDFITPSLEWLKSRIGEYVGQMEFSRIAGECVTHFRELFSRFVQN